MFLVSGDRNFKFAITYRASIASHGKMTSTVIGAISGKHSIRTKTHVFFSGVRISDVCAGTAFRHLFHAVANFVKINLRHAASMLVPARSCFQKELIRILPI